MQWSSFFLAVVLFRITCFPPTLWSKSRKHWVLSSYSWHQRRLQQIHRSVLWWNRPGQARKRVFYFCC